MSFQGRYNIYVCPDGHRTITFDVDEGTTPMLTSCRTVGCEHLTESMWYPNPLSPGTLEAFRKEGWEWYRPTLKWARRKGPEMLDHVNRGGLVLRKKLDTRGPSATAHFLDDVPNVLDSSTPPSGGEQ